jgi:hypothetical protein
MHVQEGDKERELERHMQGVTNKIRVLFYCLTLQYANTLSRKQLAVMCVQSFPFMFDCICICEAMDALGWFA